MDTRPIHFRSLVETATELRNGQISSRDLTEKMLSRVTALDPKYHSYAHVCSERALAQADAAGTDPVLAQALTDLTE